MTREPASEVQEREPAADLAALLASFSAASAELLAARTLERRFDRKYLLPREGLPELLESLREGYHLAVAGDVRAAEYDTQYFDSEDLRMHTDHGRGRRPRYKVRFRHHRSRSLSFLEVKEKGRDNRTTKYRASRDPDVRALSDEDRRFIEEHSPMDAARLLPTLRTTFRRLTLAGIEAEERVTVDFDIVASTETARTELENLCVVEVKQARLRHHTAVVAALRGRGVPEHSLSKYCIGVCRLVEGARTQLFAEQLRAVAAVAR
jgi:hypothetical protein